MSTSPYQNPNTAAFREGYSPGPHAGESTSLEHIDASTDPRARNAFMLGLLAIVLSIITGIPAIVVGVHALRHLNASDEPLKGRGLAWTGIVLGVLSVVGFVVAVAIVRR